MDPKVVFEGEHNTFVRKTFDNKRRSFSAMFVRAGICSTDEQAQKILVGIVVFCTIVGMWAVTRMGSQTFHSDQYPEGYLNDPAYYQQ